MKINTAGMLLGLAGLAVMFVVGDAVAQGRKGGRGSSNYSVAAEITVKGTVEDLKPGPGQGMHVVLKTADATLELALGPSWYQSEKNYKLAKGDQIEVVGARARIDGRDVVLVREIKKGTDTMAFRDATGFPMWRHGRR